MKSLVRPALESRPLQAPLWAYCHSSLVDHFGTDRVIPRSDVRSFLGCLVRFRKEDTGALISFLRTRGLLRNGNRGVVLYQTCRQCTKPLRDVSRSLTQLGVCAECFSEGAL